MLRTLAAALVLLVGAWLAYGFGAGYFRLALPIPFNLVATAMILSAAVYAAWRLMPRGR